MENEKVWSRSEEVSNNLLAMFRFHNQFPKKESNRARRDGMPYGIHPALAAMLMLHESSIPIDERLLYSKALMFHDVLEDTNIPSPMIDEDIRGLVVDLTFDDNVDSAAEAVKRGPKIAMLKSYDTVCNLFGLDLTDWPHDKKLRRLIKATNLFSAAYKHYPNLYIWVIADALVASMEQRLSVSAA